MKVILDHGILREKITKLKNEGKKIVFTNGCFDIIHIGHVSYLKKAKKLGDILVVAINSDESIKRIKGSKRPIINEKDRAEIVSSFFFVDYVTIFHEDTPLKLISLILPDILVKGADWEPDNIVGKEVVEANGGKVCTIEYLKGYSTTSIIEKIKKLFC